MKPIIIIFATLLLLLTGAAMAQSPALVWAKAMGGPSYDVGNSIALDASGNIFTTGFFNGTADFDPGAGSFNLTWAGGLADIFISKLDAAGNFMWAKAMSGTDTEEGLSITLDAAGNIFSTGYFQGTVDFDPGAGSYNLTSAGGSYDIFISKLDSAGNFMWAKAMSGTNSENGNSIAIDGLGNVLATGYFYATVDFDPGAGIYNLTSAGNADIFLCKLDGAGNFMWAKAIGDLSEDKGNSIAIDNSGNVYTTGYFQNTVDFDAGAGIFNLSSAGNQDIFVSKSDASGNFIWAKTMGGPSNDQGISIALDASANVLITGLFYGVADFDPGMATYNLTSTGGADIFICKTDFAGNFVWAKSMGEASEDKGNSIALDTLGNVYTTGFFQGTVDFDAGAGTFNLTSDGANDIFISKSDTAGNFVWAKAMGGIAGDMGLSIDLDGSGNVITTGYFTSTVDFDPGAGSFFIIAAGDFDIFVHKMADVSIGLVENSTAPFINLFPNPGSGLFTLLISQTSSLPIEMRLINTLGEVVHSEILQSPVKQFDFSNLPAATYYLLITNDEEQNGKRIIIMK